MSDYLTFRSRTHRTIRPLRKAKRISKSKKPEFVTAWQWAQMQEQKMHMAGYKRVLGARLADAKGE